MSEVFYNDLIDRNKTFCSLRYSNELGNYYSANIIDTEMNDWLTNSKSTQNNLSSGFLGSYSRPTLFG